MIRSIDRERQVAKRILGVVLAGGQSRRFGRDKALAELNGRSLLDHALASLVPHVAAVAVGGRIVAGTTSIADRPAAGLGPLGGLAGALHHAVAHGFDGILTIGCDMPHLPPDVATALITGDGAAIVDGQQLVGYWPATLGAALDAHLATTEDRSIRAWLREMEPRPVLVRGPALPNINTPADLARLAGEAAAFPSER
jgi:molybdopterin-guanine dinucleotide biosynthesis protein A